MKPLDEACVWLDGGRSVSGAELARMCGISLEEIAELVDYGSLRESQGQFPAELVAPLREAVRVRARFDLDLFTAGLLAQYLRRIDELERELRALRGRLPARQPAREGPGIWREPRG